MVDEMMVDEMMVDEMVDDIVEMVVNNLITTLSFSLISPFTISSTINHLIISSLSQLKPSHYQN